MSDIARPMTGPKPAAKKASPTMAKSPYDPPAPTSGRPAQNPSATAAISGELANLRAAAASVQQIRLSAQRELEMARRTRAEAQKYQQETTTKARSQAQQLLLNARLATQKEIEELIRMASAEIQKVLADIRVIRITAQEELAAQRKFTDAARLATLSLSIQRKNGGSDGRKKKQLVAKA